MNVARALRVPVGEIASPAPTGANSRVTPVFSFRVTVARPLTLAGRARRTSSHELSEKQHRANGSSRRVSRDTRTAGVSKSLPEVNRILGSLFRGSEAHVRSPKLGRYLDIESSLDGLDRLAAEFEKLFPRSTRTNESDHGRTFRDFEASILFRMFVDISEDPDALFWTGAKNDFRSMETVRILKNLLRAKRGG